VSSAPEPPWIARWLYDPQPLVRLELIRILAPLAILGFLSGRLPHADTWLTLHGFQVPSLHHPDYRQPLYLPPLPLWAAWAMAAVTVGSGLALSAGLYTRASAGVFALCLGYLALADRLASFTVSKLGTVVVLALFLTPCGARWSIDAWRRRRGLAAVPPPTQVAGGSVRFFQLLLIVIYFSSGVAKAKGDWLSHSDVVWSHLHDSYQTGVAYFLAHHLPGPVWTFFQGVVLAFEAGAPLWFALPWTRAPALVVGLGMHAFIGLCFGPVVWFALIMMVMLMAGFAPAAWLERGLDGIGRAAGRARRLLSLKSRRAEAPPPPR
jgi:uncharacterized membrane protein YphA (DoxX/SURF4 family)